MRGTKPPVPKYALIAWCQVKSQGQIYLYLYPEEAEENHENISYIIVSPMRE
jgi:hypothetical protein